MEKPEIIIENDRETDELSSLVHEFFNTINKYNEEHEDKANVVVLSRNSKGGTSFIVGNTEIQVKEFLKSVVKHEGFHNFLIGILKTLHKITYGNVGSK